MSAISNDTEFKAALEAQDITVQRELAANFVKNVLSLSNDERIARVVQVAAKHNASRDELASAYKTAKSVVMDCYTRCGADADWAAQAGYFVARAAAAALAPTEHGRQNGPAWQAAMSSRMARTAQSIETGESVAGQESELQYRILSDFINKGAAS